MREYVPAPDFARADLGLGYGRWCGLWVNVFDGHVLFVSFCYLDWSSLVRDLTSFLFLSGSGSVIVYGYSLLGRSLGDMDANRLMVIKSLFSHRPTFARQIICSSLQNFGSTTSLMSIFLHSDDLLNPEGDGRDSG